MKAFVLALILVLFPKQAYAQSYTYCDVVFALANSPQVLVDTTIQDYVSTLGSPDRASVERVSTDALNIVTITLGTAHSLRLQNNTLIAEDLVDILDAVVDMHLHGDNNVPTAQARLNAQAEIRSCRETTT